MAEIIVDALHHATGTTEKYSSRLLPSESKALEIPVSVADQSIGSRFTEFAFVVLGRPMRSAEAICDCERENQPSLGQALFLANHPDVWKKIRAREGRIPRILSACKTDRERVKSVYLLALGRPPGAGTGQPFSVPGLRRVCGTGQIALEAANGRSKDAVTRARSAPRHTPTTPCPARNG